MILKNGKRIDGSYDNLPVGTIQAFVGLVPPQGYLLCQGQKVSKTSYAELYVLCGDLFGQSTETEFYLPDLRGKTLAGIDATDINIDTIGKAFGNKEHNHTTQNHTLTVNEIPNHGHTFKVVKDNLDNSGGNLPKGNNPEGNNQGWAEPVSVGVGDNAVGLTGGNQPHNHGDTTSSSSFQPTMGINWIIKASKVYSTGAPVETELTEGNDNDKVYSCGFINSQLTRIDDNFGNIASLIPHIAYDLLTEDENWALAASQGKKLNEDKVDKSAIKNAYDIQTTNVYNCDYINKQIENTNGLIADIDQVAANKPNAINTYTTSETDTYNCTYLNNTIPNLQRTSGTVSPKTYQDSHDRWIKVGDLELHGGWERFSVLFVMQDQYNVGIFSVMCNTSSSGENGNGWCYKIAGNCRDNDCMINYNTYSTYTSFDIYCRPSYYGTGQVLCLCISSDDFNVNTSFASVDVNSWTPEEISGAKVYSTAVNPVS